MVVDNVILNKSAGIERCLSRIQKYCAGDPDILLKDELRQEAVVLNLQRACENAIDLAMHIIRVKNLGIPQSSRDAFDVLAKEGLIPEGLLAKLKNMVGFRNIAVHEYHKLDPLILVSIVKSCLGDFSDFIELIKKT